MFLTFNSLPDDLQTIMLDSIHDIITKRMKNLRTSCPYTQALEWNNGDDSYELYDIATEWNLHDGIEEVFNTFSDKSTYIEGKGIGVLFALRIDDDSILDFCNNNFKGNKFKGVSAEKAGVVLGNLFCDISWQPVRYFKYTYGNIHLILYPHIKSHLVYKNPPALENDIKKLLIEERIAWQVD